MKQIQEQTHQLIAISNFAKYIPLDLSGFKGIFACEIRSDMNVLNMVVKLYQIRNVSLFKNISDGLSKNPESKALVDAIDKELIFQETISQLDAISVKRGFQHQLNEYSSENKNDLQLGQYVTLHGIIPNLNNLYLKYDHAYVIYCFFKFFIENYDMIKMSFRHFENDNSVEEADVDETEVEDNSSLKIEDVKDNGGGVFLEMIGIVNSQAMRSFISRNIFNKHWNLDTAVSIIEKDSYFLIKHHPLYDFNIWQFSEIHNNELVNLVMSIPEENTFELANKLKQVTKQIIYIIFNKEALISQDHSKFVFTLITGLFLIYLYSLKMMKEQFIDSVYTASTRNSIDYVKIVNHAFSYVLSKFSVANTSSRILGITIESAIAEDAGDLSDPDSIKLKLDGIFKQYEYLANVDHNEFLGSVFSTLSGELGENEHVSSDSVTTDLEMALGKPTLINLKTFITDREFTKSELDVNFIFSKSPDSMMHYVNIPLTDLFKVESIISYYYCQMLFIQYNAINRKLLELPNHTSPVIRRYSDIIINGIFKEIDSQRSLASNTTSTMHLYKHFVAPFIKNEAMTSYSSLLLLYQIVIPHIHSTYGTCEFLDTFH